MTDDEKPLIKRRRCNALRPAAEKKACAEFEFLHERSRDRHFTRLKARVVKWEHLWILAVLALANLVAIWLTKH